MKKLIFSSTGFPVTIKTWQYLQDNTLNAVSAIAKSKENYEVVWGMELNQVGTQISDGAFALNGEIIPFVGSAVPAENATITINEIIETGKFNTDPNNITGVETLDAYSRKFAQIGTGGIHTFALGSLKRYRQQVIIDSGVTVFEEAVPTDGAFVGGLRIDHKNLTDEELNNSMLLYEVTRSNISSSAIGGAKYWTMYRFKDWFMLSVNIPLLNSERPKVFWQIIKLK